MSYMTKESIIRRLRSGAVIISDGEVKTMLNHLLDTVDELSEQIESIRRSCPAGNSSEEDTSAGVCGGRESKQDKGKASSSTGNA